MNFYADGNKVGSNATGVTVPTVNYLSSYSHILSGLPLKVRIGGRSSENYTYVDAFPSGGEPKPSDGTGSYGPTVITVLQNLSKRLGVSYLLSELNLLVLRLLARLIIRPDLSLKDPSGQGVMKFATTSKSVLQTIDGYTLGSVRLRSARLFPGWLICFPSRALTSMFPRVSGRARPTIPLMITRK